MTTFEQSETCPSCDGTGVDLWGGRADPNGNLAQCTMCGGRGRVDPTAPGPWIEWFGGEMPVERSVRVDVDRLDGTRVTASAGFFGWAALDRPTDIIRYRLHRIAP